MAPVLTFDQYVTARGFIRSRDRRSAFAQTARNLYNTYQTPEKLARLYREIYLKAAEINEIYPDLDQTNPTIGAACLVALSYAHYRKRLCCPKRALLTDIWLYLNELGVRLYLKGRAFLPKKDKPL